MGDQLYAPIRILHNALRKALELVRLAFARHAQLLADSVLLLW